MKTFEQCRKEYPVFRYTDYIWEEDDALLRVTYHFEIPGLASFSPTWTFRKKDGSSLNLSANRTLHTMLFDLGMVELVSYWKIACPPKVEVLAGPLDEAQIRWWKKLYYLGLGEFFYTNGIDTDQEQFLNLICTGSEFSGEAQPCPAKDGCLIPIGGGKDSACTIELLKKSDQKLIPYIINPRGATLHTVEVSGLSLSDSVQVHRTLDPARVKFL